MDFNNGLYVFNGVPGLEASKGERIAKALQKLQTKIKQLEQVRKSERDVSSMSGTDIEDITLSDVRLKLLHMQIQYMRLLLRTSRGDAKEISAAESELQHLEELAGAQNCCKETQTGMSLHEIMSTAVPPSVTSSHTEDTGTIRSSKPLAPVKEASTSNSDAVNSCSNQLPCASTPTFDAIDSHSQLPSESVQPSSRDIPLHYHLSIDDVPFILGSSAFESHNLIANAQKLIAKMKTHHKCRCGPRFHTTQNRANLPVEKSCSQEMKDSQEKIMREISKGLNEIQIKQSKLIEEFDNQNRTQLHGNKMKDIPQHEKVDQKQAKRPSNTGSTITNTTAAARLKENKQLKSTKVIKKNKHVVPTNKLRMNLPQVARQRLLRSIREVKTQLSEDDISWI